MSDSTRCPSPRIDACAVLFALVFPSLVTWVYFVALADWATEIRWAAYGLGKGTQFAFPLIWVLAVERRRFRLQPPSRRGLPEGIGFGVVVLAGMLSMYHAWPGPKGLLDAAVPAIESQLARFGLDTAMKYAALGVFYSLVHSLMEEYYWRWFVFGRLRRLVSLWPAVLISSLGFMAHHVIVLGEYFGSFSPTTVLFSLAVAVGGAVWAWIYHRSDSLYGPWLSHLFADVGIFLIGYQIVGGQFGS